MADILHHFPINGSPQDVYRAISTSEGLDSWWTNHSSVEPEAGGKYKLDFGPGYDWRATVSMWTPYSDFELTLTESDEDWKGTRVGFHLDEKDGMTFVSFHHLNWPEPNDHYRTSCFCWAMYLRLLKRYVEFGEIVRYEKRLEV
jgi:uncharacterized protein YndB with AHSA1/START domain